LFVLAWQYATWYNVLRKELHMPHVSLRVTEEEKKWMDSYAKIHGINLSDAIRSVFFSRLDDEHDLKAIREYEGEKANDAVEYYTHDEVGKSLGFK
jgi:hypothetical protein